MQCETHRVFGTQRLDGAQKGVDVTVDEPPLLVSCGLRKPTGHVQNGQVHERNPSCMGCRRDPESELGRIRVGRSVEVVVQIVELADGRHARFEHLDV